MVSRLAIVVSLIFLATGAQTLVAQPLSFQDIRDEFEFAETGSESQLHLGLKMVDEMFHYDLDEAAKWARQVQEIAKKYRHTDAYAAALMDEALIVASRNGYSDTSESLFTQARQLVDEQEGNPLFLAHFHLSRFNYSVINEEEPLNPADLLLKCRNSSQLSKDPVMEMDSLIAALNLVFLGNAEVTAPNIIKTRNQLETSSRKHGYEVGKTNVLLIDALIAKSQDNHLKCEKILHDAVTHAQRKQLLGYQVRALSTLSQFQLESVLQPIRKRHGSLESLSQSQRKELAVALEPVRKKFRQCLGLAKRLKKASSLFESLVFCAWTEFHCGGYQKALDLIEEAEQLNLESYRLYQRRDELFRLAIKIYRHRNAPKKVQEYLRRLASEEHINGLVAANRKIQKYSLELTNASAKTAAEAANNRQNNLSLLNENREFRSRAESFEYVSWILGLTLGMLVLAFLLVWSRGQLHKMELKLSDEKQTSQANREMRDVLQERVNRLQRMESLGMLAGGVAHDFNNLLVGVICNAEVLETQKESLTEFAQQRIQQIISSAEQAADLSRQMLAYAGKTQIQRNALDLNVLAEKMIRILLATVGNEAKVTIETDNRPTYAEVDETQLEQILLNLVSNAKQACGPDGKITVRTGRELITSVHGDGELRGTREKGGAFVYVEVQDNGPGIEPENLQHIFEPFYSAREGGRGLGLAVVYGIVNGHEGLIRLRSSPGKGTTFRILLPQATPEQVSPPHILHNTHSENEVSPKSQSGTILVADDEPSIVEFAETLLTMNGWQVATANSGRIVLELLKKNHQQFACVLLDVRMPDMGADEVLEHLKSEELNVPIILMSGYSKNQLSTYLDNNQIETIIAKPFRTSDLLEVVESVIRKRKATPVST